LGEFISSSPPEKRREPLTRRSEPSFISGAREPVSTSFALCDLVDALVPSSRRKFFEPIGVASIGGTEAADMRAIPSSLAFAAQWHAAGHRFSRDIAALGARAAVLIGRGCSATTWDAVAASYAPVLDACVPTFAYSPVPLYTATAASKEATSAGHVAAVPFRCRSVLAGYANCDSFAARLVRVAGRAERLLQAGAYTHHFEAVGVERADIEEAVVQVWTLALDYGMSPHASDDTWEI
jgi:hypothetical protein